jgi:hypothetical protein
MRETAPIEIAAERRPRPGGVRRTAAWLHLVAAAAIAAGVFVQVYLIGAYLFGAGQGVLDAHRSVGFATHAIEVLVLVLALAARLARADVLLSLALAVTGTVQIALASSERWIGGLHPLLALVVLALALMLVRRRARAYGLLRAAPTPAE